MDIIGSLSSVLPYISYIVNLFTRLIEILSSYLGVDITIPGVPAEETPVEDSEAIPE